MHPKGYKKHQQDQAGKPENLEQAVFGDGDRSDVVQVIANGAGDVELWIYGHQHAVYPAGTDPVAVEEQAMLVLELLTGTADRLRDAVVGELVGIEEAAEMLGISRAAFDNRRARGSLPDPDLVRSGRPLWWRDSLAGVADRRVGPRG